MKSIGASIRRTFACLFAAVLLLPLAADLRLCIGSDHLGLDASNGAEECCAEDEHGAAGDTGSLHAANNNADCGNCLDVSLPENLSLARVQPAPDFTQPFPIALLRLIAPLPPTAAIHSASPLQSTAQLPVHSGTLLRI